MSKDSRAEQKVFVRRMAIFGPLLKNARSIAEAPNISSALLGGLETAGEAMEGGIAADEAVIARAAALRSAALEEAKILADNGTLLCA